MEPLLPALRSELQNADTSELKQTIVNAPFRHRVAMVTLGIGIIVLLIDNKKEGQIYRVALSKTELAEGTVRISLKKFENIKIPDGHADNIIARAILTGQPQITDDWQYLFTPALSPEQARLNQAGGGIACSFVYPLDFSGNKGALIFSYYKEPPQIGDEERKFMAAYSTLVSGRLADRDIQLDDLLGK